ncbi:tight adherence pilus pseudopilin TadF [Shewanella marina]|uniref:tight adherence pilus pseudopilin TadF n=1 Tax=Shewanella marina TaxID=487319 RepID=UPI00046F5F35|nr:tight adherence pilus pseudopilin TadF [Shewanella marina]
MKKRQQGSFVVELSFVLIFFSFVIVFMADIAMQLFHQSNLQRASYSLVNVLKERSRFYIDIDEDKHQIIRFQVDDNDLKDMQIMADRLLNSSNEKPVNYGIRIESLSNSAMRNNPSLVEFGLLSCLSDDKLKTDSPLLPNNLEESEYTLYQVSLCYQIDSWFSRLINLDDKHTIASSAVMVGR